MQRHQLGGGASLQPSRSRAPLRAAGPRLAPPRPLQAPPRPLPARPRPLPARRGGRRALRVSAAAGDDGSDILAKYGLNGNSKPAPRRAPESGPLSGAPAGNGVWLLICLNLAGFVADHVLHLPGAAALYLNHAHPQWWQWVTHAFMHANYQHLVGNLFNLLLFGRMVEETEGPGVVAIYLLCAAGAAAAAVLAQPAVVRGAVTVSLGASGAIFGLFAVSVLTRLSWDPRRLVEGFILGNFVVQQVLNEAKAQAAGGLTIGGLQVGHVAHLGGALAGVLLVWLLRQLPDNDNDGA
ncbi:RBL11 [Scenedesmus sp. PABB004]|nr:RBL11 [Scenedesmus sp. PABB004]